MPDHSEVAATELATPPGPRRDPHSARRASLGAPCQAEHARVSHVLLQAPHAPRLRVGVQEVRWDFGDNEVPVDPLEKAVESLALPTVRVREEGERLRPREREQGAQEGSPRARVVEHV
eukprot:CAMPEP_0182856158 /NCGR_PEP_ID=MMETSP0034_2-20130328/2271_1 /TAXON_ID=156128 /ORGANISM="Nephroselmis pyriformis, Strain CCMP717" /LENGTH=118 /DNA_ID=CAMNT_0024987203 /DNA_START=204 /DNA_END=561 /DNA_ORIENTATION=-